MTFLCNRSIVVLGAVTSQYVVEHPQIIDANTYIAQQSLRPSVTEITNMTTGVVYVAFDRAVVAPVGNGVQGVINPAVYTRTGPIAATPGDFDLAITSGSGWGAVDAAIPFSSRYMSVYTTIAGAVIVNYGKI